MKLKHKLVIKKLIRKIPLPDLESIPRRIFIPIAIAIYLLSIFVLTQNNRPSNKMGHPELKRDILAIELLAYNTLVAIEGDTNPAYESLIKRDAEIKKEEISLDQIEDDIRKNAPNISRDLKIIRNSRDKRRYKSMVKKSDRLYEEQRSIKKKKSALARERMYQVNHPFISEIIQIHKQLLEHQTYLLSFDNDWRKKGGHIIEFVFACLAFISFAAGFLRLFML